MIHDDMMHDGMIYDAMMNNVMMVKNTSYNKILTEEK